MEVKLGLWDPENVSLFPEWRCPREEVALHFFIRMSIPYFVTKFSLA